MPSGTIFEKFITIPADVLDKFKWTCYTLKHEYLCAGQKCRNVMGIRAERMTRMATIEIKMLGGFEIRVNGKPVLAQLAQSRKATALVQYLVLRRGERVSHKVLTDTLWAGERSTNPDMALRAILHRFRLMIDAEGLDEMKDCIVTSRGYYQWNPHLDCSVDVFEVNDLSELARKESDAEKRSRIYEQIVNLYDGRLLPQSASEPWVESVSVRLHGQYRTAILNLLELCKNGARAPASLRCVPARWSWTPTRSAFIWKRSSRWRRWVATRRRRIWHAAAAPWAACIMPLSRAAQALPTARCARQTAIWRARSPS